MNVLAIETATAVCSVALRAGGRVAAEETIEEMNVHAERLMSLIDSVSRRSLVPPRSFDAIAVSIGPGSFTGLRIGLSVAKGLCFALEKPLVAVPTLDALARRAADALVVETPYLLAALDARRNEVYCALFRINGRAVEREGDVRDMTLEDLPAFVAGRSVSYTGNAGAKLAARFGDAVRFVPAEYASCRASAVALIGEEMALRGAFADVRTVEPAYVKDFHTPFKHS
jgi:tRNA threonylcarbamoyladenosine biosynthesis protein TsaB